MVLVGLGVGIDYALLVFSRFRTEILAGASRSAAVATALNTAGRSVLVAGLTVMVALGGLVMLGLASLQGVALGVALTVVVTMAASLTLLPSLLSILGARLERTIRRRAQGRDTSGRRWRAWTVVVTRLRLPAVLVGTGLLVALALPAATMRLGIADAGTDPVGTTSRAAYDLVAAGFGPGYNGPLVVLESGGSSTAVVDALSMTPGVSRVLPTQPITDGSGALTVVIPATAPQDTATADLVSRLRSEVLPPIEALDGTRSSCGRHAGRRGGLLRGGGVAVPLCVGAVIGLSSLLLLVVFRSLTIPVKAAILNVLSIGASLGVVTLVFAERDVRAGAGTGRGVVCR